MRLLRLLLPSLVVLAAGLLATGALFPPEIEGLPVTPIDTLVLVPVLRLAMFVSGSLAVGGILVGGLLGGGRDALRLAARAAIGYSAASTALAVATLADVLATPWWGALDTTMLRSFLTQIDEGRYFVAQVVIGITVVWVLGRARSGLDSVFALIAMSVAVALPAFSGHSAAAVTHWVASAIMIVHLLATHVWVGGVLVLLLAPGRNALLAFGRVASVAMPVLVVSGFASLAARVNDWDAATHDLYSVVVVLKFLAVMGIVGLANRVREQATAALLDGSRDVVSLTRRTLAMEGMVMMVALALAVVLARMANP